MGRMIHARQLATRHVCECVGMCVCECHFSSSPHTHTPTHSHTPTGRMAACIATGHVPMYVGSGLQRELMTMFRAQNSSARGAHEQKRKRILPPSQQLVLAELAGGVAEVAS